MGKSIVLPDRGELILPESLPVLYACSASGRMTFSLTMSCAVWGAQVICDPWESFCCWGGGGGLGCSHASVQVGRKVNESSQRLLAPPATTGRIFSWRRHAFLHGFAFSMHSGGGAMMDQATLPSALSTLEEGRRRWTRIWFGQLVRFRCV